MRKQYSGLLLAVVLTLLGSASVPAQANAGLVDKLIGQTASSHPSEMARLLTKRSTDVKKSAAEKRRLYAGYLTKAIAENAQLDTLQKDSARKNLEKLIDQVAFEVLVIHSRNKNEDEWLRESLMRHYSTKFTAAELKRLTDFFATIEGQYTLSYIAGSPERQQSEEINYTPEEFLAYNNFVIKTPLGKKFFDVFMIDSKSDLTLKDAAASKQILAETKELTTSLSLNQIISQFFTENTETASSGKSILVNEFIDAFRKLQDETVKEYSNSFNDAKVTDDLKETHFEMFDLALKENTSLNDAQKAFAKANYDKLSGILAAKQKLFGEEMIRSTNKITTGHLRSEIIKYLSVAEIKSISADLEKPDGVLSRLVSFVESENQATRQAFEEFVKTSAGGKLVTIMRERLPELIESTMRDESQKYMQGSFMLFEETELNKMINEFVASNFKK